MARLYMETTKIAAHKTANEISELLAMSGAKQIMQPMWKILNGRRPPQTRAQYAEADLDQAVRVAWRQVLRWVQAQLALIETGMVATEEVFMPYLRLRDGRTLFMEATSRGFDKALPALDLDESNGAGA